MTDDQQLLANLERIATREELVWNDAADPDELESLEASLGIEVPSAYRRVLEWHDGTDDREFCSIEESVEAAEELLELWERRRRGGQPRPERAQHRTRHRTRQGR